MCRWFIKYVLATLVASVMTGLFLNAHGQQAPSTSWMDRYGVVAPQSWRNARWATARQGQIQVTEVRASVSIKDQLARTCLTISLRNPSRRNEQAVLLISVPPGASVCDFQFQGKSPEATAKILPLSEAKRIYSSIVSRLRDPALLEFVGYALIRTSVFPVPAGGNQIVRLSYEQLLPRLGQRIDYILPRTEVVSSEQVPWFIELSLTTSQPVATAYSPSHLIDVKRHSPTRLSISLRKGEETEPGPFRLSYILQKGPVTASLMAYPDSEGEGGYFLLLAGIPPLPEKLKRNMPKREVILVLDRSGSMSGRKIEQARAAALQTLESLEEGEAFNVIDFNDQICSFRKTSVLKNSRTMAQVRQYLNLIRAGGSTNLNDAILEAVRQPGIEGMLPLVLVLTDGRPTCGVTDEWQIRDNVNKANKQKRRIFTFGVGYDVNFPLLDKIASDSRAKMVIVSPEQSVETKVCQLFKSLSGPVLTNPVLEVVDQHGQVLTDLLRDVMPPVLPDLFEDDQLVVVGRYLRQAKLRFKLHGTYLGKPRTFKFEFSLKSASMRNAYVGRIWASRRIAMLIDQIRQMKATPETAADSSATKELVEQIVALSKKFGILTEYTAFLAEEGTNLADTRAQNEVALRNFSNRLHRARAGIGAANQQANISNMRAQQVSRLRNAFYDANMRFVQITTVQQIGNRALFRRGNQWIDSQILHLRRDGSQQQTYKPDRIIKYGTPEFEELLHKLSVSNDQGLLHLGDSVLFHLEGEVVQVKF